ncbi:MAG TPA: 50S ribosomal protein L4 [Candidatus Dadabacteria bacterium]|jgi:large subunit ribosomal protein L4|nr:50S ribosomal protein L4 [Candidatus Dadabacteria bacterium]
MDLHVVNINNEQIDKFTFDFDDSFEINRKVISQVVRWQLSRRRSGTASTKNRALVTSSNKKPFKQKGTGNARAGSRTSPIWRGGGVIFGPSPKDWSINVPKKIKKLALLHTMIYRIKQNSFTVIDSFNLDTHKSKDFAAKLDLLKLSKKILIISDHENNNLELSSRNIKNVKLIKSVGVNVYDLLNHKSIIIDKITFNNLIERIK